MTGKEFLQQLTGDSSDIVQRLLRLLDATGASYCVIGGLAVNAYTEPVVSLDLDLVVVLSELDKLLGLAAEVGFTAENFPHSINLAFPRSDLRVQLQLDERYQPFIERSGPKTVLGYELRVASVEDVICGKVWAYSDESRRKSKRQKDLADIMRLIETHPDLIELLPSSIRVQL